MENVEKAGKITWEGIKLLFQLTIDNLPILLMWMAIGLIVGVISGVLSLRICTSKGVFDRPAKKRFSKFLNMFYQPMMFMTVLFLFLTLGTFWGTTKIVEKEIYHGVDVSINALKDNVLGVDSNRAKMYAMIENVAQTGRYVKTFNEAVSEVSVDYINKEKGNGYLMSKMTHFLVADEIEEKLWEFEKAILFYAAVTVAAKAGLEGAPPESYDVFSFALDKWMESDFETDTEVIKNDISKFIYDHVKPLVFGLFIAPIIISILIFLIPIIHLLITRWRLKKKARIQNSMAI